MKREEGREGSGKAKMARAKDGSAFKEQGVSLGSRPALTPEARERQMIGLAMDLVEERLRNGTATSQETTHFLKLATEKERIERKLSEKQLELMEAKRQHIESQVKIEELYSNALEAMRRYSGYEDSDEPR